MICTELENAKKKTTSAALIDVFATTKLSCIITYWEKLLDSYWQITDLKGKYVIHFECKYRKEITINN